MNSYSKKKVAMMIGAVVAFVGIIVVSSIILMGMRGIDSRLIIDNIESCSAGITDTAKKNTFDNLYNLVVEQDKIEGINRKSDGKYHAELRTETCKTTEFKSEDVVSSYTTEAMVDIIDRNYSFKISYVWVKKDNNEVDLGEILAICPEEDELKNGEFNCSENVMVTTEFENDAILYVLPYIGDGYTLYSKVGVKDEKEYRIIVIEYKPPESIYLNGALSTFKEEKKQDAIDYLTSQGIDVDKYPIEETYYVFH